MDNNPIDQIRQRLLEQGLICELDDLTALYSDAKDLSLDEIRDALKGIPTIAIDKAFEQERRR